MNAGKKSCLHHFQADYWFSASFCVIWTAGQQNLTVSLESLDACERTGTASPQNSIYLSFHISKAARANQKLENKKINKAL